MNRIALMLGESVILLSHHSIAVKLLGIAVLVLACNSQAALSQSRVVERGPHHRKWTHVTSEIGPDGKTLLRTNRYTELGTGLHYQNSKGEWVETEEVIEIVPEGGREGNSR